MNATVETANAQFTVHEYASSDASPLRYGKLVNKENPETGSPMLYIPGLGGSVKGALGFLSLLLGTFSPIIAPDLRGYGLNPLEKPLHSASCHLPDLEAFHAATRLDKLSNITLCGISLGAALSTHLAVAHPQRYQRVALMAPAFAAHPEMFPLGYQLKNIFNWVLSGTEHKIHLPYGIEALTRNPAVLNDPQYRDTPPIDLTIDYLLSVKGINQQALAKTKQLTLPTLVIVPGCDLVCDPRAMRQGYANIPESTPKLLKDYPDLYHDVFFEAEYPQIARDLLEWAK